MNARHSSRRGFVLLEALLAVAIFALGILALGRCVSNCVAVEQVKVEDTLARRALENRIAEIEAGAMSPSMPMTEDLPEPFRGLRLTQASAPLAFRNENDQQLEGISVVTLSVSWRSSGENHVREQTFYAYAR